MNIADAYGADTEPSAPDSAPVAMREAYASAVKTPRPKTIRNARNALMAEGFSVVRFCGTKLDEPASPPSPDDGKHGVRLHWRRGHWRMQPCGPKLSQVKRVWIRPMLVGQDSGGPIPGHRYVVDPRQDQH